MEPFSALAIATGVVQFIEFSSRVLSGVAEIRASTSGRLPEYEELQKLTAGLAD
ncbi:hypothetical protein BJX70DRAFT_372353 [Aspergillus crustosus]